MPSSTARLGEPAPEASTAQLLGAFGAVYVIWGSTYLAIRFAIETLPPLLMASVRFLVAGGLLYVWARSRGSPRPTWPQWRAAAVVGGLLFVGGNGAVVVSEQWVPSGLVALLVACVPLWMVVVDWLWGSRARPTGRVVGGLLLGFGGVAFLAGSPGAGAGGAHELLGALLVVVGSLAWAMGSIYARQAEMPPRPRLWVGMQMLAGGALLLPVSLATGELGRLDPGAVSLKSVLALAYLVVFGALVAFSAYIWLLGVSTPARVGTYAYVNPVVALFLGWGLADEPLNVRSVVAAAIIVGSVVVITTGGAPARRESRRGVRPPLSPQVGEQ
ncbi:MAG: EamA family transporter [Longimicrobiales bacterium]|nr:EamA family transporter [Longimicrobiales bacterium]